MARGLRIRNKVTDMVEKNLVVERKLTVDLTICRIGHGRLFFLPMLLACAVVSRGLPQRLGWRHPVPVAIFGRSNSWWLSSGEDYHEPARDGDPEPGIPVGDGAVAGVRAGALSGSADPAAGPVLGRRRGRRDRAPVGGTDQAVSRHDRDREPGRRWRHHRDRRGG